MDSEEARAADRVTFVGVGVNLALTILKAMAGSACHSAALVADAGHSLSDLVSDFVTLWAVRIGRLPPDEDFPYGHGKFEAMGSLFLSLLLIGAGVGIGAESYSRLVGVLFGGVKGGVGVPTAPALAVALLSVLSKEWLYRITKKVGERIGSPVVIANAWHHRSDAYSSVLALGSIALAMAVPGMLAADSAAGILVAGMICTTGIEILFDAAKQLTDAADEELTTSITNTLKPEIASTFSSSTLTNDNHSDILSINRVRARQVGSSSLVDVAVTVAPGMSSSATRAIEERLRWKIMRTHPRVIDADVHATTNEICPLLIAQTADAAQLQKEIDEANEIQVTKSGGSGKGKKSAGIGVMTSTVEIEAGIRKTLRQQNDVQVSNVTIHYDTNLSVDVDVNVRIGTLKELNGKSHYTLQQAAGLVRDLKQILIKEHDDIRNIRVYLDLNDVDGGSTTKPHQIQEESLNSLSGVISGEDSALDLTSIEETILGMRNQTMDGVL